MASRSDRPPRCRYRPPPRLKPRRRARVGASSRAQRDGRLIRCAAARAGTSSRAPVIRARLRSTTATSARSSSGASLVSWAMSPTTPLPDALSRTLRPSPTRGTETLRRHRCGLSDAFCVISHDDARRGQAVASARPGGRRGSRCDDASVDSKQERLHSSSSERVRCASRHARLGRSPRAPAGRAYTPASAWGKRASARPRRVLARIVPSRCVVRAWVSYCFSRMRA